MNITIFGCEKSLMDALQTQLHACLGRDAPAQIMQVVMDRRGFRFERPRAPSLIFFVIDEPNMLLDSEKASRWGEDYPLVLAATHPQYALEGIRQKVKHFILFPLEREEVKEALNRAGVKT